MREDTAAMFNLRCCELGIVSNEALDAFTIGMVYDLLIERINDRAEYAKKADQGDINKFFG